MYLLKWYSLILIKYIKYKWLLSRNADQFIGGARKDTAKEDNQMFLNNLLGLGLTVVDDKGFNQGGSSLKKELNDLKIKFRRKNNLLNMGGNWYGK